LPLCVAFVFNVFYFWLQDRRIDKAQANWLLWFIVPALPM